MQHSSDPLPDAGQHALDGRHRGCCKVMSSCAASRVIYFLLFHNPFHNYNVHTSRTHISPGTSHCLLTWPSPTCTHLHTPALYSTATAQRLCEHFSRPSTAHQTNPHSHRLTPNPRDDLRPRPRRPRKRPRHRRHGIHRPLPLCRCQRQANGGVV